jgi:hypothetical protein
MKKISLSILFIIVFFRAQSFADMAVPSLGSAISFALFTTTGAVGNTGVSNITGNIGTNTGAISGFGTATVTGNIDNGNAVTAQSAADLTTAYNQISAITPTATHGAVFGNGETLDAGVYSLGAAGSVAGVLTLDAQGDPNAIFIFKIWGAFNTGAGTTIILANGAHAGNVFWLVEGAVSMGAATTMKGTLIANNGAISMGAGGNLEGRMFSTTGAVAIYNDIIYLPADYNFSWIGAVSTNWNTAENWLNNAVPTSADQALVGVTQLFNYFPNIPAAFGTDSVGSIIFGTLGGKASGVVVNAGSILIVGGTITYLSDTGSSKGYICTLSGLGTINSGSIAITATTSITGKPYTETISSSITNINITNNIILTSTKPGTDTFNSSFNITGGTALLNGNLQTINSAGSTSSFLVLPTTIATLQFTNATALSGLSTTGTNVITFNNPGATTEYSGAAQTVYNNDSIPGLSLGISYQNIKFSGTGLKTMQAGNLTVAGDYTNALANDIGNNISLLNNNVSFNGTTQNLMGGIGNGTIFNKVAFSGSGTKTMVSGDFYVINLGVLTMISPAKLIAGSVTAGGASFLTLMSDSASTATVYTPTGTNITGNANVQRSISSGMGTRGYRLITSPVNVSLSTGGTGNIGLSYLNSSTSFGGNAYNGAYTQGPGTGFTYNGAVNPIIYLYDESQPTNNTSFVSGKNVGIYAITNASGSPAYSVTTISGSPAVTTAGISIPVGNSFLFYFVGSNQSSVVAGSRIPDATTLTATGYLNQGNVPVKFWTTSSTTIPYDVTTGTTNYGLSQVGNPYASTISLIALYSDNYNASSNPIGAAFYELLPGGNYVSYNASNGNVSDSRASGSIISGQGFLVQATGASPAETLTFKEDQKIAYPSGLSPSATPKMMLDVAVQTVAKNNAGLHLQLAKDSVTYAQTGIYFNNTATDKYKPSQDAAQVNGGTPGVYLSSFSSDSVKLAINVSGDYAMGKSIRIYINAVSDGPYILSLADITAIDTTDYNVYLVDKHTKDSSDIVHSKNYSFNISRTDSTSFGAGRFVLDIDHKPVLPYMLVRFAGQKVTKGVQLTWTTINAGNYTGYTLEKLGNNGGYDSLYTLQSATGNTAYNFIDVHPIIGNNSYRLKQNGISGAITYSGIITVGYNSITSNGALTLYPNPAQTTMKVSLNSNSTNTSSYIADTYNTTGKLIKHESVNSPNWSEDVSSYNLGIYIMKIKDNNGNIIGQAKFAKVD